MGDDVGDLEGCATSAHRFAVADALPSIESAAAPAVSRPCLERSDSTLHAPRLTAESPGCEPGARHFEFGRRRNIHAAASDQGLGQQGI